MKRLFVATRQLRLLGAWLYCFTAFTSWNEVTALVAGSVPDPLDPRRVMAQLSVFSTARQTLIKDARCSAVLKTYIRGFAMASTSSKEPNFELSPVPRSSETVRTAAALIIG